MSREFLTEIEDLEKELAAVRADCADLQAQCDSLHHDLRSDRDDLAEALDQREDLADKLAQARAELNVNKQVIHGLKHRNEQLNRMIKVFIRNADCWVRAQDSVEKSGLAVLKPFFKEIERKVDEHQKFAELLEDPEG